MDFEDSSCSSSVSSSCSSSSNQRSPSGPSAACSTSTSRAALAPSPKRKTGRKKFRETRHPVYHGVRERNGGKWVCEVREPRKKSRIWLGTFPAPEMAARAHDVAAIALRGESAAHLNFPDSARALPRARSAAAEDIRRAAAKAAEMFGPSKSTSRSPPSSSVMPPAGPAAAGTSPGRDGGQADAAAGPARSSPPAVFVDEELFNMPELLEDMARGLLVTPPAMQKEFDWDGVDEGHMDLSLWTD